MSTPSPETLRELLDLLRPPRDESAPADRDLGQRVSDGPYRDARETFEAQLKEEAARLATERAHLDERAALLEAIRIAHRPHAGPRRFMRTLMLGALLGTTSTLTALGLMVLPQLAHHRPVVVMPPSSWRDHARTEVHVPSAPPSVDSSRPGPLERSVTRLSDTVWDLDRRVLEQQHHLQVLLRDLRLVPHDEPFVPDDMRGAPLGARLYGVRRGSLAHLLGLENGDTLLAVNGVLLENGALHELAQRDFSDVSRIEFSLLRRGEPVTFTYLLR